MGREARGMVRHGGRLAEARSLLETDELIVRSPFRLTVPRSQIREAIADGAVLTVVYAGGTVELDLGERQAARWAHDIANPKTLADKLGVKPGRRVRLLGGADPELAGRGSLVEDGEADVVFLYAATAADLAPLATLEDGIARDGAIWVIRPKGRDEITEGMVLAAGREAGLHDVKIARVSAVDTAMKFVIPVDRR